MKFFRQEVLRKVEINIVAKQDKPVVKPMKLIKMKTMKTMGIYS